MLRSQGKQGKQLLRCVQAGAQWVRTSCPIKALQIGQTHYAPKTCSIQLPQTCHREFATSKGDQSNRGEEQRGTDNKKWWQSKIWQIGGLIISGTALGSGAWGIKHYISDPKFPSHPAPSTLPSNEKPIASIYEEPYKDLIEIDWKTGNEFYIRENELNYLKQILVFERNINNPKMHVMLGFNKCGKTSLISKFLADHYPKDHPHYIYLHLKEEQIMSMEDLLERLKVEILRVFGKFGIAKAENKWGIKFNLGGKFGAKIPETPVEGEVAMGLILERMKSKEYEAKNSLIRDLKDLIRQYSKKEKNGRPFLIVIDEINALKDILGEGGNIQDIKLFKSFITMLEDVTKNKKTANVLFCSADSSVKFMFEATGLGWDRYFRPFYIGFMNEEQMMRYLQEKVKLEKHLATVAWNYVGGDFNYWRNVIGEPYSLRSEEDFKKTCENEMKYAVAAITPTSFALPPYGTYITRKQQNILEEIYVLLKESSEKRDEKMVNYKEMRRIYGDENIDELLKAGALFLISGKYMSQDRTIDKETAVLVANCPIHQMAIDKYVENMKKEEAQKKAGIQSNKKVQKEDPKNGI